MERYEGFLERREGSAAGVCNKICVSGGAHVDTTPDLC